MGVKFSSMPYSADKKVPCEDGSYKIYTILEILEKLVLGHVIVYIVENFISMVFH